MLELINSARRGGGEERKEGVHRGKQTIVQAPRLCAPRGLLRVGHLAALLGDCCVVTHRCSSARAAPAHSRYPALALLWWTKDKTHGKSL